MDLLLTREMVGQRLAVWPLDQLLDGSRTLGGLAGLLLVQCVEFQFELFYRAGKPLGGLAELHALQLGEAGLELGYLQPLRLHRPEQLLHQRLERSCIYNAMLKFSTQESPPRLHEHLQLAEETHQPIIAGTL